MKKMLSFLGLAISILLIVAGSLYHLFYFSPKYNVINLKKGWNVTYRNEQYLNTNPEKMSSQVGSTFSKGDTITLTLDKTLNFDNLPFPYIFFKTQFCAYTVYLDGVPIAEKDIDKIEKNEFIGICFNTVKLPQDFYGKKLSIKLYVNENDTKADIISPIIGNFDDLFRYNMHTVLIPAFTSIFLVIFGLGFLLISLVFYVKSSGVAPQVISSVLCIFIGIWMITAYNIFDFVFDSAIATTVEFISMYTILPLLFMYLTSLHKRYNNTVLMFLSIASFVFAVVATALHMANIVHINHFQKPFYLISISAFLLILYDYMDIKNKTLSSSTSILMVGVNVLCICLITYAIVAISGSFVDYRQSAVMTVLIPSGCLFFITTHLLNHFIFMTRSFAQKKEYQSLTKIAYIDNLTGIPNRASCDKKLSDVQSSGKDYCLVSLDLNGLKEVNDNSGHPAGDRLLKSFSKCLIDVFSTRGYCYRIGGDEFLVILMEVTSNEVDSMISILNEQLKQLDLEDPEANHSASYGYAFSSEIPGNDAHDVYMLADSRMYEYKRKYYSHMSS